MRLNMHLKQRLRKPSYKDNFVISDVDITWSMRQVNSLARESSQQTQGTLYIETKEHRLHHIDLWKRARSTFPEEDLFDFPFSGPTKSKFEIQVILNWTENIGELSFSHYEHGSKLFEGTILQVEELLEFVSPFLKTEVEPGEKAVFEITNDGVYTASQVNSFCDHPSDVYKV